jgi:hypothetical protein
MLCTESLCFDETECARSREMDSVSSAGGRFTLFCSLGVVYFKPQISIRSKSSTLDCVRYRLFIHGLLVHSRARSSARIHSRAQ